MDALTSHIWYKFTLTVSNAGQWRRRCSRSPYTPWLWQGCRRQKPSLFSDQNLHNLSVLYRPLIILLNIVALFISYGLLAAADQIGCGLDSWCMCGLKWANEGNAVASAENNFCQYSVILVLTRLFSLPLLRGSFSSNLGKPGLATATKVFQSILCMLVQGVPFQMTDH